MLKQLPSEILYVFVSSNISAVVVHRTNYPRILGRVALVVINAIKAWRKWVPCESLVFVINKTYAGHCAAVVLCFKSVEQPLDG